LGLIKADAAAAPQPAPEPVAAAKTAPSRR